MTYNIITPFVSSTIWNLRKTLSLFKKSDDFEYQGSDYSLSLVKLKPLLVEQASYKSQLSSVLFIFFLSPKYFQRWYIDQNKTVDISPKNGET